MKQGKRRLPIPVDEAEVGRLLDWIKKTVA
jgi:hypothetical protein